MLKPRKATEQMAKQDRWYSTSTQVFWCCKALLDGREVSHGAEIREVKGWRLAATCERLRKRYGWPILTDYRHPENVAYSRLTPGANLAKLRFPPSGRALADGAAA